MLNNLPVCRHIGLVVILVILLIVAVWPAHAQEPVPPSDSRLQDALAFLTASAIPASAFHDLSAAGGDAPSVAAVLAGIGFTPEQIQAFSTPENLFALNQAVNPNPVAAVMAAAVAIGGPYGLQPVDVTALLLLVNDRYALMTALAQRGMSKEQMEAFLAEIMPLVEPALRNGDLKCAPVLAMSTAFAQIGVPNPDQAVNDISGYLDEPKLLATYFRARGLGDPQVQAAVETVNTLVGQGLNKDLIIGSLVRTAIYRLERLGLSPQLLDDLLAAPGNLKVVREYLIGAGLSGDALELAMVQLEGVLGANGEKLTLARLHVFQANEVVTLFASAGVNLADLEKVLSQQDCPEVLRAWLAQQYYLDNAVIDAFLSGLNQSSFVRTLAPEDAAGFVAHIGSGGEYLTGLGPTIGPVGPYPGEDYEYEYPGGDYPGEDYGEGVIVITETESSESSGGN